MLCTCVYVCVLVCMCVYVCLLALVCVLALDARLSVCLSVICLCICSAGAMFDAAPVPSTSSARTSSEPRPAALSSIALLACVAVAVGVLACVAVAVGVLACVAVAVGAMAVCEQTRLMHIARLRSQRIRSNVASVVRSHRTNVASVVRSHRTLDAHRTLEITSHA